MQHPNCLAYAQPYPEGLCAGVHISREQLPPGDAGIRRTADVMRQLIRENIGHPIVRRHAEQAVRGLPPGQPLEELNAVYGYLADRTEYRRDPHEVEYLQAPWWLLSSGVDKGEAPQVDCDDLTMLSLSMLGSLGFPTAIRVVSTRPDARYNHVYGVAQASGLRVPVDLTRARLGHVPKRPEVRAFEVEV